MPDELTARELLRRGEIPARDFLCEATTALLEARKYWRPAGCSARLFKRQGMDDPFAVPEGWKRPEPRPVYAAGRFVRLDKKAGGAKGGAKGGGGGGSTASGGVPAWVQELRDRAARQEAPVAKKEVPRQSHTPSFTGKAPDPVDRTPPRAPGPEPRQRTDVKRPRAQPIGATGEPVDRTPPRVVPGEAPTGERRAARRGPTVPEGFDRTPPRVAGPPASATHGRPKPVVGGTDAIDRTPPRVVPGEAPERGPLRGTRRPPPTNVDRTPPRVAGPEAPREPRESRARRPASPAREGVDRTPPLVAHTPTDSRGEPVDMARRRRQAQRKGLPADFDRTPPRVLPPGIEEAPRPAPKPIQEPVAPIAATPPTPVEPPPPRPIAPPSVDDLFGAPQEGRVRISRKPATEGDKPRRPLVTTEAPVERRPPLLRDAPPVSNSVDPAPPAAPVEAPRPEPPKPRPPEPPQLEARPPEPPKPPPAPAGGLDDLFGAPPPRRPAKTGGGLDDLFGGAQEGRVRIGGRARKAVATEGEPAPEPAPAAPAVDRRPPLLDLPKDKIPKN